MGCFQLKQKLHTNLFEAFKLVFNTNRKLSVYKGLDNQFVSSSIKDIETVINYYSHSSSAEPSWRFDGVQDRTSRGCVSLRARR